MKTALRLVDGPPKRDTSEACHHVASITFEYLRGLIQDDGPEFDSPLNYELRRLASEMLGRAGRPLSDFYCSKP